jgi:hypothetical protein
MDTLRSFWAWTPHLLWLSRAHEDDAQRAVRTLGILNAMEDLNKGLQQTKGIQSPSYGYSYGRVVVGEMGRKVAKNNWRWEKSTISLPVSKGWLPPIRLWSVVDLSLIQGYLPARTWALTSEGLLNLSLCTKSCVRVVPQSPGCGSATRTPRQSVESEVTLLLERWEQVKAGHGHVVLLTGDAGIGRAVWSKCSRNTWRMNHMYAGMSGAVLSEHNALSD